MQVVPPVEVPSQAEPGAAAAVLVDVRTPEGLLSAFSNGTRHIRLQNHVDLRQQPVPSTGMQQGVGTISWDTRSVTVRQSGVVHCTFPANS